MDYNDAKAQDTIIDQPSFSTQLIIDCQSQQADDHQDCINAMYHIRLNQLNIQHPHQQQQNQQQSLDFIYSLTASK